MAKEAKPDTWMPIVIGDYKKDTDRLTRDQHGGYLLLMMAYWCTGPLLDDDEELAAIVKATPAEWRKLRPKMARFFVVKDGIWRHGRIDQELETWGAKKVKASSKGKAGAHARWHAKGNAPGMPRASLKDSTAPSSTEVDALNGQSTLCGRDAVDERAEGSSPPRSWNGPAEVWNAFLAELGAEATVNSVGRCTWQDLPAPTLIAPTGWIQNRIRREARAVLVRLGIQVERRAA